MTTSVDTSLKSRNLEYLQFDLHLFNPPYEGNITKTKKILGKSTNGCFKDKEMQTQLYKNGAQFYYIIFSL